MQYLRLGWPTHLLVLPNSLFQQLLKELEEKWKILHTNTHTHTHSTAGGWKEMSDVLCVLSTAEKLHLSTFTSEFFPLLPYVHSLSLSLQEALFGQICWSWSYLEISCQLKCRLWLGTHRVIAKAAIYSLTEISLLFFLPLRMHAAAICAWPKKPDLRSVSIGILSWPQCAFHCSTALRWPHIPSLLTSDKRRCRGFSPHLCHFWRSQQTRSSFYMHPSQYTKPHDTTHKALLTRPSALSTGGVNTSQRVTVSF